MAVTVKTLIPAKQAEATQTEQYIAISCRAIIDKFTATNTSAANVTLSVNLITSGGAVGANNLIVNARAIAPNETYTLPELVGQVLDPGGIISTIASAATSITIRASGREIVT